MKHYPLLDEFTLELLNQNLTGGSIISYTSYLRTFVPDPAPKVDRNYLTIVAMALSAKKGAFALQYLDDIQSKYGLVAESEKQSAFNALKTWIAGIVAAFNNKALASVKTSLTNAGIQLFSQSNLNAKSRHIDVKDIVSLAITDEGMVFCIYANNDGNLIPAQIFTPTDDN